MRRRAALGSGVLLEGDCLDKVIELTDCGGQRFELVYVDPPFNTGLSHGARLSEGLRATGVEAYADRWAGVEAFLAMLEPRLAALREALSEEGSLWLHLDHRTVHDAKVSADRVFGRNAFQGEIIWLPGNGARRRSGPSMTHQTILVYARGRSLLWNGDDPLLREPYADTSRRMHFTQSDESGRRYRERVLGGKAYRYYADAGRRIGSVWADCPAMRANTPLLRETTGYPTQKPERLLERIVRAATRPGARVLDPMCGSGTTLVVAERLGRRWAGIDASPLACRLARKRLVSALRDRKTLAQRQTR